MYFNKFNYLQPDKHKDCNCRLICRVNLRTGNRELIYGNTKLTNQKDIVEYLKENFNIDTNNLFQILPQEKVSSLLTPDLNQNLINIEKAVNYDIVFYLNIIV